MALWLRITAAIWVVLVASLALTVFLNYAKFDSSYGELSRSRFQVLAQDVKSSVESGLQVGLGLGELRTTQQLIERTKAEASEIRSVVIVDQFGTVLFETEGADTKGKVPAAQISAILASAQGTGVWSATEGNAAMLGVPIINSFDVAVGAAVLRYDRSAQAAVVGKALANMVTAMLIIVAVVTLAIVPLVMLTFRGVRQTFQHIIDAAQTTLPAELLVSNDEVAEALEQHEDGEAPATVDDPAMPVVANDPLEARFSAFVDSAVGALEQIHQVEAAAANDSARR